MHEVFVSRANVETFKANQAPPYPTTGNDRIDSSPSRGSHPHSLTCPLLFPSHPLPVFRTFWNVFPRFCPAPLLGGNGRMDKQTGSVPGSPRVFQPLFLRVSRTALLSGKISSFPRIHDDTAGHQTLKKTSSRKREYS